MTHDSHDQARQWIALGRDISDEQRKALLGHLAECAACRDYSESASHVISALRSLPLAADSRLVRATQMRVRFHASRLQEARQRLWLVGLSCLGVGVSATFTIPLLWQFFTWIGTWTGVAKPVWETGFVFFCVAPALLVSVLLLARGTHSTTEGEQPR